MLLFVRSDVQNLWGVPTFLGVLILSRGKEKNMCTRWHICKTLSTYKKVHVQKFYYKLKKADLLRLHWNSNLQLIEILGICISQPMVLAGSSPQICIYQSLLSICIFQPRALNLYLLALANRVGIIRVKGCI